MLPSLVSTLLCPYTVVSPDSVPIRQVTTFLGSLCLEKLARSISQQLTEENVSRVALCIVRVPRLILSYS